MTERLASFTAQAESNERALAFTRYVKMLVLANGDARGAVDLYAQRWPGSRFQRTIEKAAVAPGTTTDANWASALAEARHFAEGIMVLARPATVLGRLPGVRPVPFNVRIPSQTTMSSVGWAGQYQAIKGSVLGFETLTVSVTKVAGFVVLTDELVRSSSPAAEALVQADLVAGIVQFSDEQLLDPAVAAVANVNPASITHDAEEVASTGSTAAQVSTDLRAALAEIVAPNGALVAPVIIMKPTTAIYLAGLQGAAGGLVFPNVGANGGDIWGVPVVTSNSVGNRIVVLDASELMVADEGAEVDASRQAAVQMDSAPNSPPTASSVFTSLWQTNLVGVMVKRHLFWRMRRADAVAYISGVTF